ncbi:DUF892 family protein [Shigella flexneri]
MDRLNVLMKLWSPQSNLKIKRMKCVAMEGLLKKLMRSSKVPESEVRDAALIAAAQKVEHYEIASYGTLATLAEQLDYGKAAKLLKETLEKKGHRHQTD